MIFSVFSVAFLNGDKNSNFVTLLNRQYYKQITLTPSTIIYLCWYSGWVRKSPKICWRNYRDLCVAFSTFHVLSTLHWLVLIWPFSISTTFFDIYLLERNQYLLILDRVQTKINRTTSQVNGKTYKEYNIKNQL